LLALAYAYFVPAQLTLTPYLVFLIGVIVYIGIQSLLGLTTHPQQGHACRTACHYNHRHGLAALRLSLTTLALLPPL
jgi:hypothetical protein